MIFFPGGIHHMRITAEEMRLFASRPPLPPPPHSSLHSPPFYSQLPPFNSSQGSTVYHPQHPYLYPSQLSTPNSSHDSVLYPPNDADLYSSRRSIYNAYQKSHFDSPQQSTFNPSQESTRFSSQHSTPTSSQQSTFNLSQESISNPSQDPISIPSHESKPKSTQESAFDSTQAAPNSSREQIVEIPSTRARFLFACTASKSCTRSFKTRYDLKTHMRKHTNERPYICRELGCNRSYKWRSSRDHHSRVHARKHAEQASPEPFPNAIYIPNPERVLPSIKMEQTEINLRLPRIPNNSSPSPHAYNPEDIDEILDEILAKPASRI